VEQLSRGVGPVDPGLTASTEGSPRPADGVRSGHEGREASQHMMVGTEISEKKCARSRKPASRDKGAWRRFHRGGKVFTEAQSQDSRSLRKDLHGAWKDGREEGVSMEEKVVLGFWTWRAEDWYKGLALARCRYFSPQLT
jgi:hypothetical protein